MPLAQPLPTPQVPDKSQRTFIPFGEYLPDQPEIGNSVTIAKNVIPSLNSYRPIRGLSTQSATLDNPAKGAVSARDKDSVTYNYAGDADKLYMVSTASATDKSKLGLPGGGYVVAETEGWEFAKFGEDLIAVTIAEPPQNITLGGANFADLGGSPPKARHICTIGKQDAFLVLANVDDSVDGLVPNRVQWSAAGDSTGWTSGTGLAGQQDLQGNGGWIQRVCGGEFGVIWQERAIWRMDFVGAPDVFSFSELEDSRGTPAPGSVVKVGQIFFYLGPDGFYAFDGARSVPIGSNKINTTFYSEIDQNYLYRITSVSDPSNNLVLWSYPTGNSKGNGDPDKILIYDYVNGKWSFAEADHQMMFLAVSDSVDLEGLDAFSTNLDTLTPSLDSRQWVGNSTLWAAFNRDNKLAFFNGATLPATIDTGDFRGSPDKLTRLSLAEPVVEGAALSNVTVQVASRLKASDTVSFGSAKMLSTRSGKADLRETDRYHRIRINIASDDDWTHATGAHVKFTPVGIP